MLDTYVRRAPTYWSKLPYFSRLRGCLLFDKIYLKPDIYDNLLTDKPLPFNVGVLIHEKTHYERMKDMGLFTFGVKYIFSRRGRFEEEHRAIAEQMKYLKSVGETYDTDKTARYLSSWLYFWSISYDEAKSLLDTTWDTV